MEIKSSERKLYSYVRWWEDMGRKRNQETGRIWKLGHRKSGEHQFGFNKHFIYWHSYSCFSEQVLLNWIRILYLKEGKLFVHQRWRLCLVFSQSIYDECWLSCQVQTIIMMTACHQDSNSDIQYSYREKKYSKQNNFEATSGRMVKNVGEQRQHFTWGGESRFSNLASWNVVKMTKCISFIEGH